MKTTETFKEIIDKHLQEVAKKDEVFAEKLKDPNKKLDDCITYILNQVKDSGCNGFADEEIFGMAIHYYDEKEVKPGAKISNANVVVNHSVELSSEEIEKAKQEALDNVIAEEKERLKAKPKKIKKEDANVEPSLFD